MSSGVKEFMDKLVEYLKANDMENFNRIDTIMRKGICKSDIEFAFYFAYMHYIFTNNIKEASDILIEALKNCNAR